MTDELPTELPIGLLIKAGFLLGIGFCAALAAAGLGWALVILLTTPS